MIVRLVLRNLRRSLRRTLLIVSTISITTFLFVLLISIPGSIDRVVSDASTSLRLIVTNRTRGFGAIPDRYCRDIAQMPGVSACTAFNGMMATYRDEADPFVAMGGGPELPDVFPDYEQTPAEVAACNADRRCAIVGELLARKYDWKMGQQITIRDTGVGHRQMTFVIGGITHSRRYPNNFTFHREYLLEARKAAGQDMHGIAAFLIVRVNTVEDMAPIARRIDEIYRNSGYETRTMTESENMANALSQIGNIRGIILLLCAVVLTTVSLLAANAMAMMVREKIAEIAVFRALGFSRTFVAELLYGESLAISLTGGIIGTGLAWWLLHSGVNSGLIGGMGSLFVDFDGIVSALAASLIIGIASVTVPVLSAVEITPAAAFREVV